MYLNNQALIELFEFFNFLGKKKNCENLVQKYQKLCQKLEKMKLKHGEIVLEKRKNKFIIVDFDDFYIYEKNNIIYAGNPRYPEKDEPIQKDLKNINKNCDLLSGKKPYLTINEIQKIIYLIKKIENC